MRPDDPTREDSTLHRTVAFLLWLLLCMWAATALAAADSDTRDKEGYKPAVLRISNRDIATFRDAVAGNPPTQRARDAEQRINNLPDRDLSNPISLKKGSIGNQQGIAVFLGAEPAFALLQSDLDPVYDKSLDHAAAVAAGNLSRALEAERAQREPATLIRGTLLSLAATLVFAFVVWVILHLRNRLSSAMQRLALRPFSLFVVRGLDLTAPIILLLRRITNFLLGLLIMFVTYLWVTFVLRRFPYTQPWGDTLSTRLFDLLKELGTGVVQAVPGILTVILIFMIANLVTHLITTFFRAIEQGKISVPFMYPDTAGATRWLTVSLIWLFSMAIAYPYIPGSNSAAFQGISVIAGLMLTLGSAGIINQAMSGLVLVYSRALTKGEMVQIDDTEGVVTSVGLLSTKIETHPHEEYTIPNAVVVGTQIKNYSRLAKTKGATVTVEVSIGYDTSWRQVTAMLEMAARNTPGIRRDMPLQVMQKELGDFYVKYELVAGIEQPQERFPVLTNLSGNILDVFNHYGVQIMSPSFHMQPDHKVIVPKEQWFAPPARGESGARS